MVFYFSALFIFFLSFASFAQNDYIPYYHLCRKADSLYGKKNIDSASAVYKNAFSKVDYVHNKFLKQAAKVEKKKGNKKKARAYLSEINSHNQSIAIPYKKLIDSLSREDQRVRGSKYMKARDYYYKSLYDTSFHSQPDKLNEARACMQEWWKTDSLNILEITKLIQLYEFPGEKLVGSDSYHAAVVIILHFDKDTSNRILGNVLEKALKSGDLLPADYAWIIDRHLNASGKRQLYYSMAFNRENLSEAEKNEFNGNRASIGLGRLQDIIVIKKGNSIKIKPN